MIRCVRGVSVFIAHAQDTTSMNADTILFIIEGPLYQVQLMFSTQQHAHWRLDSSNCNWVSVDGDSQTGSAEVLQTKYRLDSLS